MNAQEEREIIAMIKAEIAEAIAKIKPQETEKVTPVESKKKK